MVDVRTIGDKSVRCGFTQSSLWLFPDAKQNVGVIAQKRPVMVGRVPRKFIRRILTPAQIGGSNYMHCAPCNSSLPAPLAVLIISGLARPKRWSSVDRSFFRGGMGVTERLGGSWRIALFAVVASLAWISASFARCPQVSVKFVSEAGVEIIAAIPSLGLIFVSIEDRFREFQEDDLELCGLPGTRPVSSPSPTLSQITTPQSVSLSVLARRRTRCVVDESSPFFWLSHSGLPARGRPESITAGYSPRAILADFTRST